MGCPEFKTSNGIQIGGIDPATIKVAEVEKPKEEPVQEVKKTTKKSK